MLPYVVKLISIFLSFPSILPLFYVVYLISLPISLAISFTYIPSHITPYSLAEDAVLRMVLLLGAELFTVEVVPGQPNRVTGRV